MRDYKNIPLKTICENLVNDEIKGKYYWVKTFSRHLYDMDNNTSDTARFNYKLAITYIFIIEQMKHSKGEMAGQNFILEDWQIALIMIMFGWEIKNSKGDWVRRFRTALVFVPRKNGKSILGSAVALADDIIGMEAQNDICIFSTKRDQSRIAHDMLWYLIQSMPKSVRQNYRKVMGVIHRKDGGKAYALGRDSKTEDGLNISFALSDESHAYSDSSLIDVVVSSQGSRKNPFLLYVTTAGHNTASPLLAELDHCRSILDGYDKGQDDFKYFGFIAEASKDTDPFSIEALHEANPNIGVSVSLDYLVDYQKEAMERTEKRVEFMTKNLNIFQNASEIFIAREAYEKCVINQKQFDTFDTSKAKRLVIGLDLSISTDWTAINKTWLFENGKSSDGTGLMFLVDTEFIIPDNNTRERGRQLRVPLENWVHKKFVTTTKGKVIDFDYVYDRIKELIHKSWDEGIEVCLSYDPWSSQQIISRLDNELGFNKLGQDVFKSSQGYSLNESIVTLKNKVILDSIRFKYNPAFSWHLSNMELETDNYGRLRITKESNIKKIDGVAALLNSIKFLLYKQDEDVGSSNLVFL